MIKKIVVDWNTNTLTVEPGDAGISGEESHLIGDVLFPVMRVLHIGIDGALAKFDPKDWRQLRAIETLVETVKEDKRIAVSSTLDLFGEIAPDIKKETYRQTYKTKKVKAELQKIKDKFASRVRSRNYKARKAGLVADLTVEQAEKLVKSVKGKCPNCPRKGIKWFEFELAHIVHHTDGGGSTLSNTRPLCFDCNRNQGATA